MLNKNHCCEAMKNWANDLYCPLNYRADLRYYSVSAPKILMKKYGVWPGYTVDYCPNCGTKLPTDLTEQRMKILQEKYGIHDIYDDKQKKDIPKEFKTDEWWKKRGL